MKHINIYDTFNKVYDAYGITISPYNYILYTP